MNLTTKDARRLLSETGTRERCAEEATRLWARHLDEQGGKCHSACPTCRFLGGAIRTVTHQPKPCRPMGWDADAVARQIARTVKAHLVQLERNGARS